MPRYTAPLLPCSAPCVLALMVHQRSGTKALMAVMEGCGWYTAAAAGAASQLLVIAGSAMASHVMAEIKALYITCSYTWVFHMGVPPLHVAPACLSSSGTGRAQAAVLARVNSNGESSSHAY
jgi:hypothetical protein